MKKVISVLVIIMLLCSGFVLFVDNDFNIEATTGGGSSSGNDLMLDNTFMFDVLDNLTYVVHNDSIWGQDIRMGRAFGTPGDRWTANYIWKELTNLDLENFQKLQLGPIANHPLKYYTSMINVTGFNLHIDLFI